MTKLRRDQVYIDIPNNEAILYLHRGFVEVINEPAKPIEVEVEPDEVEVKALVVKKSKTPDKPKSP